MTDTSKLSQQAQELARLCPPDGCGNVPDVETVLKDRPDLISGLNEFIKYCVEHGENVAESKAVHATGHAMKSVASALKGGKPPKT